MMECSFVVKRKELQSALSNFNRLAKSANRKATVIEVTVIDGGLTLNIPGVELTAQAQTKGTAKFSTKLWYFADIVKSYDTDTLSCILTENTLQVSNTKFNVHTAFFKDDSILRSIDLPLNYTYVDLYRLKHSGKYTEQEIEFNHLSERIEDSVLKIKADIDKAHLILKKYGFAKKEVSELIMTKLKDSLPKA
jgi:hypothetical protein